MSIDRTLQSYLVAFAFTYSCHSLGVGRKPLVLVDKMGWGILKMIPGPVCPDWDENTANGADLCEEGRKGERGFAADEKHHRRGDFPSVSAGPTHGNGRLVSYV